MKVKHECNRKKNDDQMIKRKPLIQDLIHRTTRSQQEASYQAREMINETRERNKRKMTTELGRESYQEKAINPRFDPQFMMSAAVKRRNPK